MFEDMSLEDLFAEADRVGDKYLTEEEIATRNAELDRVRYETWMTLTDEDLDLL